MNIIELADQAGLDWQRGWTLDDNEPNRFSVFAELVAAHEREECAKLCDSEWSGDADAYDHSIAANECAVAIRARSKA
jgi:hypothetical protein